MCKLKKTIIFQYLVYRLLNGSKAVKNAKMLKKKTLVKSPIANVFSDWDRKINCYSDSKYIIVTDSVLQSDL